MTDDQDLWERLGRGCRGVREGAVAGSADFGQVRFELDGEKYLLGCATPVTGGPQPRQVWVYVDRHYRPSQGELGSSGSGR